jgi:sigma-B regulation protein RsbU (phosphoserine phosphatase)
MRAELAAARQIQLSMLPDAPPKLDWIDLAGASLPATEVGGDFFGYFKLDDDSIAIVVADVAGHGVGSAIVLAGIKSGLHLLQDELREPTRVMARLDRMVREAARQRMLVTMLIAVVHRNGTMRIVSAGHPPLLHVSREGVTECGIGALPLGTRLESRYATVERTWSDGDLLLCCTDGLLELQAPTGEAYGAERVAQFLRDLDPSRNAESARHELLARLSRFRADATQEDDITLVVARLRRGAGSE